MKNFMEILARHNMSYIIDFCFTYPTMISTLFFGGANGKLSKCGNAWPQGFPNQFGLHKTTNMLLLDSFPSENPLLLILFGTFPTHGLSDIQKNPLL